METEIPLPLEPATPAPASDTPAPSAETPETREQSADQSVAEHEAAAPIPKRHGRRARSHEASPEDVPRIATLTKKLRETEAALAEARKTPVAPATPAAPTTDTPAPVATRPSTPTPEPRPVAPAEDDPEPDPADYINDPSKNYVKDQAKWEARQAIREENERVETKAAQKREHDYWLVREADALKAYPDFKQVAYVDSPIPKGSLVDRFIREAGGGLHVLYHLHKNRAELDKMLALPIFDPATNTYPQIEALSQLALRLAPKKENNGQPAAAATGSVAAPAPVKPQPRPPNPVRTGPLTPANEPPGANASVAEHERYWNQRKAR